MKKVLMLFLIVGFVFACQKDNEVTSMNPEEAHGQLLSDLDIVTAESGVQFLVLSRNTVTGEVLEQVELSANCGPSSASCDATIWCCPPPDDRTGDEEYDQ